MAIGNPGIRRPSQSIELTYEGGALPATPGTSVASALIAAGVLACRRAPDGDRGVFCGMGVCGECLVEIDGRAGRLACMTEVQDGMRIARQPARVAVSFDDIALEGELLERELACQCLVIGAGPAGLAAATAAAAAGVETVLVDDRAKLGGQYYKQPASGFELEPDRLDAQYRSGRALIERTARSGVRVLSGVRIWGAASPGELYGAGELERWRLRPQRLVLATGAYERAVPFPGWTLPGVMTTGAAQSLLRSYQTAPGERILVAGNGPLNVQLAAELVRAGANLVALVELADAFTVRAVPDLVRMAAAAPGLARDGLRYLATLRAARVPVIAGSTVVRAGAADGGDRVGSAVVARIAADGTPRPGSERTFDVDAVCLGMGFMPGGELARLLGADHAVDRSTGGYVVARSAAGRTSLEHVWCVGDGADVQGAKVAQAAGTLAGLDVAASLGRAGGPGAPAARQRRRQQLFQRALWRAYRGPSLFSQLATPETVVCRCESVTLGELDAMIVEVGSAGALKRLTRAGMGRCQGRFCGFVIADRIAARTGQPVDGRSGFAAQLPLRPTPVSVLAAEPGSPSEPV